MFECENRHTIHDGCCEEFDEKFEALPCLECYGGTPGVVCGVDWSASRPTGDEEDYEDPCKCWKGEKCVAPKPCPNCGDGKEPSKPSMEDEDWREYAPSSLCSICCLEVLTSDMELAFLRKKFNRSKDKTLQEIKDNYPSLKELQLYLREDKN
jgi:hypothetical protein